MLMNRKIHLLVALCLLLAGCRSQQEHAYIKDAPRGVAEDISNLSTAVILPDDLLYIYIYSQMPEAANPFNEETNKGRAAVKPRGYRVSENGSIAFPILGTIEAAGRTLPELAQILERRLRDEGYVTDAVASVSLMNFHVAVIGEVKQPRMVHSGNSRLTIFEALAQCGDITSDGLRNSVVVVRNSDGAQLVDTLDLTSRRVLESPFYYLQQNDIVYVEPTPKKKRKAYRNEDWPRYLQIGASGISLAYRTIYQISRVSQ